MPLSSMCALQGGDRMTVFLVWQGRWEPWLVGVASSVELAELIGAQARTRLVRTLDEAGVMNPREAAEKRMDWDVEIREVTLDVLL